MREQIHEKKNEETTEKLNGIIFDRDDCSCELYSDHQDEIK